MNQYFVLLKVTSTSSVFKRGRYQDPEKKTNILIIKSGGNFQKQTE